jgi:hypothetical protein
LQTLKHGIEDNEQKLLNVRVDGASRIDSLDQTSQKWELKAEDSVTAWYEGAPRGKRRIEHHKLVRRWINGTAPFLEESFTTIYDGRITQTLWTSSGALDNPSHRLRGQIEAGMPVAFMYESATGWEYSLYGAYEESGHLSNLFHLPSTQLLARETSFGGVACVQLQVTMPNGVPVITYYCDPARAYALLGCERARGDGVVVLKWQVDAFVEAVPGVYYPTAATKELTLGNGRRERTTYQASAVVANDPNFSDDLFTMKWPPKTKVRDLTTTNTFIVAADDKPINQRIEGQIGQVRSNAVMMPEPTQTAPVASSPDRRLRVWLVVAGIGIMVVLVFALAGFGGHKK